MARIWLIVVGIAWVSLPGCSGGETRKDELPDPTRGVDLATAAPAAHDVPLAAWRGELTTWQKANSEPFASDGHESAANTLYLNASAAEHRTSKTPFAEGDALALVSAPEGGTTATWFMVKRPAGYHSEGADWMYATLDASGEVTLSGPASEPAIAEACGDCHKFGAAGTDYVFGVPAGSR